MKANFALSLSFEGLRLLHRAAGGWRRVGEVALDTSDLAAALAGLRARAEALEPGGIASKLIIPDAQIKYLTIHSGDADPGARRDMARAALDGATPYAVEDLAFDIAPDGAQTHVAAVARETLAEAEGFAVQYGFNPIATVAVPGAAPFLGEPFFGATDHAARMLGAGDTVEPDGIAVVEIAAVAEAAVVVEEDVPQAAESPSQPEQQPEPEPVSAHDSPETLEAEGAQEADGDAPALPAGGFASRRRARKATAPDAPSLGGVTRAQDVPPTPARAASRIVTTPISGTDAFAAPPLRGSAPPAPRSEADEAPPDLTSPAAAAASLRKPIPAQIAREAADPPARRAGFLSRRRKTPLPASAQAPEGKAAARAARASEQRRMTLFGARKPAAADGGAAVAGKPRYLALILTAALLVFLAGVAAWAALFTEEGVAGLLKPVRQGVPTEDAAVATARSAPEAPAPKSAAEPASEPGPAPLPTALDLAALLDAAPPPRVLERADPPPAPELDADAAAELYAATGIWPLAPGRAPTPRAVPLDRLYQPSIDPRGASLDAVALPGPQDHTRDVRPGPQVPPPPQGTRFSYDARGLIVPSEEGARAPGGFAVYPGPPPAVPPARPDAPAAAADPAQEAARDAADAALAERRPRARPEGLIENTERRSLGGISRAELAQLRPRERPFTEKDAQEAAGQTPTEQAAAQSLRPAAKPSNFAQVVATAQAQRRAAAQQPAPAQPAAAAPTAAAAPQLPTRASIAQEATVRNALNLRRVNLMGVYGKPSERSALVRLANGRYQKVQIGDRLDGGRVSAIGDSELRYQKNGRNISLTMPRS